MIWTEPPRPIRLLVGVVEVFFSQFRDNRILQAVRDRCIYRIALQNGLDSIQPRLGFCGTFFSPDKGTAELRDLLLVDQPTVRGNHVVLFLETLHSTISADRLL